MNIHFISISFFSSIHSISFPYELVLNIVLGINILSWVYLNPLKSKYTDFFVCISSPFNRTFLSASLAIQNDKYEQWLDSILRICTMIINFSFITTLSNGRFRLSIKKVMEGIQSCFIATDIGYDTFTWSLACYF